MFVVGADHDVECEKELDIVNAAVVRLSLMGSKVNVSFLMLVTGDIVVEYLGPKDAFDVWPIVVSDTPDLVTVLKDANDLGMLTVALEDPCTATAKDDVDRKDRGAEIDEGGDEMKVDGN